jgi:hypothetical protein
MAKNLERLNSALTEIEAIGGLACEDCSRTLTTGEARAVPLVVSSEDKRFSRIDILCLDCLRGRTDDPTRH